MVIALVISFVFSLKRSIVRNTSIENMGSWLGDTTGDSAARAPPSLNTRIMMS